MELHSYAKHRASKKWSIDQKRRLVEARINCEEAFRSKPKTSLLPWKKVIFQAKLDDFNAVFVRKQWANMVTKYMQYKQDRLGNKPTHDIDTETVNKITQEWEFFQPLHRYMTRKTTNLHSYALKTQEENEKNVHEQHSSESLEDISSKQTPPQVSTSSNDHLNVCSSDTNEDYTLVMLPTIETLPNTDHDFYSKRAEQQSCYFADVEEDTLESITMDVATTVANTTVVNGADIQHTQEFVVNGTQVYEAKPILPNVVNQETVQTDIKREPPEDNGETDLISNKIKDSNNTLSSERDKYYRHKRRFNKRMERRFDAILNVVGQIAKAEYPSIDISPLVEAGSGLIKGFISSSDDDSNDDNAHRVR